METDRIAQRRDFVTAMATGRWSITELCARYGVSRPTAYKWWRRWENDGDAGLAEHSRRPSACPHQVSERVEALLLEARQRYGWGAGKLLHVLQRRHPRQTWPSRSTINAVLDRHGLLRKQRRGRPRVHPGAVPLATAGPNEIWPADFKGQFKTGDGIYCFPLTVTDHYSRTILCCRALSSTKTSEVRPVFLALFRKVGLPEAIRTDNGTPFASTGIHGLTPLNAWWMQLGIVHQRIRPGYPQANGTHERMHRDLKRETALPPAITSGRQQRRFDEFRRRYNEERPHEALDDRTPTTLWRPSPRPYPERLPLPQYPSTFEVRRVGSGCFRFGGDWVFVSHALDGQELGLEEVMDGVWNVVYYQTVLGRLDERTRKISAG